MIYTGAKALQYLSVPVYTIFKNLTIIVIAYGEVLWFGGSVSPTILLSFGLIVFSSIVAAWADADAARGSSKASQSLATLQVGYTWMALNVFCQAAFVLGMRKVIKKMGFKDWDSKCFFLDIYLYRRDMMTDADLFPYSHVLQQLFDHSGPDCWLTSA